MQLRKSPIAVAVVALFGALPLAANAQSASYSGTPYTGTAPSAPAVIPAANFDKGGEGVGYHDLSAGNLGGQYRTSEAVDIYASTDSASGPYQVQNFQNGEWMNYTVNVPASGNYDLSIRASNNYGTGAFHIEVDGVNVTGTISVPKTGSWSTYQWFGKKDVALAAGKHVVRIVAETQWFNVTALSLQAGTPTSTGYAGTPYSGTPASLPGVVAAANFDKGGEGVAYHDLSSGNLGGQYRTSEAVDIYASTDSASGPYQVQNFQNGEWMNYTVNVPASGSYDLGIRASNNYNTGAFHIEVDGANVTGTISVPKTGDWNTYQWFGKKGVPLAAGKHVVTIVAETQWFNVSALSVQAGSTSTGSTSGSTGTSTGGSTGTSTGSSGSTAYAGTPYTGTAASLPALLAAVNFDKGGEGVAYHDLSSGNLGGQYRTSEAVDIYASTDSASGPYQVQNFQNGEWMNYTVNVPASGSYDLGIRASNNYNTGAFHIEVDGANVTGTISVPKTGDWNTYQWFGKNSVPLTAGKHVVKLVSEQQWFNVSALSLGSPTTGGSTGGTTGGSTTPTTPTTSTGPGNLLFWSGFENATGLATPTDCYGNGCWQDVFGGDAVTGYDWAKFTGNGVRYQMLSNASSAPNPSTIYNYMKNELQTVIGRKGTPTNVMANTIYQSGCCGTGSQSGANGSTQNPLMLQPSADIPEMYISQWIMLQPDLPQKMVSATWREVFEWKTTDTDFRIQLAIKSNGNGGFYWMANGDSYVPSYHELWRVNNTSVPVPYGKWMKVEVYWKRANDNTGRVWVAVDGQVIADHYGSNVGPNRSRINRVMVNQLYSGSTYPIYQWVDDLQIWSSFPTAKQGDAWYDPPYAQH